MMTQKGHVELSQYDIQGDFEKLWLSWFFFFDFKGSGNGGSGIS